LLPNRGRYPERARCRLTASLHQARQEGPPRLHEVAGTRSAAWDANRVLVPLRHEAKPRSSLRGVPELRGNKAIEDAAIAYVIDRERDAGRVPIDTRYVGAPADIESPPRIIEVKAVGKPTGRGDGFMWLETRQVETARENLNFYVYLVENVRQGDPALFTLKVFGGEQLQRLLSRAKERRYFEIPVPVREYDSAPAGLDG